MSLPLRYTALSLATVVTLALALLVGYGAQDTEALPLCFCPQSEFAYQETIPTWGMGATCEQAIQDGVASSTQQAIQICGADGVCDIDPDPIIVTPCAFMNGQWKVDVKIRFKCFLCRNSL